MKTFIRDIGCQIREAVEQAGLVDLPSVESREAWLLGMGGSALSGGIVHRVLLDEPEPVTWTVVRDYFLPRKPGKGSLVLAMSYSGDTEETLSAARQAAQYPVSMAAISKGGSLRTWAGKRNIPWVQIPPRPPGFQPRFALPFMATAALCLLQRGGLLRRLENLHELADWLDSLNLSKEGQDLAAFFHGHLPVVYTVSPHEDGVARTWCIKFNENSKVPALSGSLPEINHNEMMAFPRGSPLRPAFLLLVDSHADPRVLRRFPLLAEVLTNNGHPVKTLPMVGDTPLRRILHSLTLADWTTFHLALLQGIDPVGIPDIQQFKVRLKG